ncbi:MAG: transcription elongation factor GreA [Capsulimonas sp.]|uniref:transcription elongation factor GreA n=1 Tax=Capsulimonas sp. TaxID=2494211 RepID=UPI003264E3B6
MPDDEIVLTQAKYQELEKELLRLQTTERRVIAERISTARSLGDLRENFDYHDAKRQQGLLESKIINLKRILDRGRIVAYEVGNDVVQLGSHVKVHDEEFDEDIEYQIVGVMEADPATDKISNTSPVGKALLGHKVGEKVEVQTPAGVAIYEIIELS